MVGKGANATVYKAVDNVDYSLVAIKQFNSTNTRKSYIDSVMVFIIIIVIIIIIIIIIKNNNEK